MKTTVCFLSFCFISTMLLCSTDASSINLNYAKYGNLIEHHRHQLPDIKSHHMNHSDLHYAANTGSVDKTGERPSISILVNGSESANVIAGQDLVVTVTFSTGLTQATYTLWADVNDNGQYDSGTDLMIESPETITDNSPNDENPAVGVYQGTYSGNSDGPNTVSNLYLLFRAEDTEESDVASAHILPSVSSYSVAGTITPHMAILIVVAVPVNQDDTQYMTSSNADGTYILYVPQNTQYNVFCFDPLNLTQGLICSTTYDNLTINGHLAGYNFTFSQATSSISGYITDQNNLPVQGINVYANPEEGGMEYTGTSDNNGYYHIGLLPGAWDVSVDTDPDYNNYLSEDSQMVGVPPDTDVNHNIRIYETNGIITGSTYLDNQLASGLPVFSTSYYGYSSTNSNQNGNYFLKVSTLADNMGGNNVIAPSWNMPENTYCTDNYQAVLSGAADIDFHYFSVSGGLQGHVYDATTSQPIEGGGWISIIGNDQFFNADVDNEGFYSIGLPMGVYAVTVYSNQYYTSTIQNISIGNSMLTLDFNLTPVIFTGSIYGFVYDIQTSLPIPDVDISVATSNFTSFTGSGEAGYYSISVPNGTFSLHASKMLYIDVSTDNLVVANNTLFHDIYMTPFVDNDDQVLPSTVNAISLMNFPNPFNPDTTIRFGLPGAMKVKLEIMNIRGEKINTLCNGIEEKGVHEVIWNGTNSQGNSVASGVYMVKITTSHEQITRKMLLLK
ncbi:MAG TPA: carboxypeptidase regulatory-like domain-containing protein [Candidatus Cloacimonadota bacterium]|nr:carboxypeptidase regulatory-like domain-containing protein [Candidatus Cloacimonadota bacterium]